MKTLVISGKSKYISKIILGKDKGVINDYHKEIIILADENQIKWYNRNDNVSLYDDELVFLISWKWLVSSSKNTLVVIHDSLLPKYRGFNPLVTALINGDEEIGATAIIASEFVDEGPIISQKKIQIHYPIRIQEAIDKLKAIYSELVIDLFEIIFILRKELEITKQDENNASFSLWRDELDYFIDWNNSAEVIQRFVHAVGAPYDGAKILIDNLIIKVNEVNIVEDKKIINRTVGKLISIQNNKKSACVVCRTGIIEISNCVTSEGKPYEFKKIRTRLDSFQ